MTWLPPGLAASLRSESQASGQLAIARDQRIISAAHQRHGQLHGFGELPVVVGKPAQDRPSGIFLEGRDGIVVILPPAVDDDLNPPAIDAGSRGCRHVAVDHSQRQRAWLGHKQNGLRLLQDQGPVAGVHHANIHHHEIVGRGRRTE